jgi:hypothetical protein
MAMHYPAIISVKDGFHMNVQEFAVGVPHPFQP